MSHLNYSKNFKGVVDVWLRDANFYLPLIEFVNAVMTRKSELSIAEREMIAAYVSKQNSCWFCVGVHKQTLLKMGVDKNIVECIVDDIEKAKVEEKFKQVLRFSHKLNQPNQEILKTDIDALKTHNYSDQSIEDIINVVALFNYVNRLIDGLGIKGTNEYFSFVGQMLSEKGYSPVLDMVKAKVR